MVRRRGEAALTPPISISHSLVGPTMHGESLQRLVTPARAATHLTGVGEDA